MPSVPRRRLIRAFGAVFGAAALMFTGLQVWYLGWIVHYADHAPETTAFMEIRRTEGATLDHQWVEYERISHWLKRAVIAAEDARFMDHAGIDWTALGKAIEENREAGTVVRGGSTITQQLAKNLFLSPRQSYMRKAQEAAIALMIEVVLDKRRILELYLNIIEWGDGVFGAAAAARHYYDTPVGSLSRWQAAVLAARIPNPRFYDRRGTTPWLLERAGDIHRWSNQVRIPDR
jgi:monofunctional biosynthetic peptidoglycan transglycosylase